MPKDIYLIIHGVQDIIMNRYSEILLPKIFIFGTFDTKKSYFGYFCIQNKTDPRISSEKSM